MQRLIILLLLTTLAGGWWLYSSRTVETADSFSVGEILGGSAADGYARALEPRQFNFPQDHGPHPKFLNEWWYFTGNLSDKASRRFGFQLVFFRNTLAPETLKRTSAWGTNQAWMAHLALTDTAGERFHAFERFSRGAKGLNRSKA